MIIVLTVIGIALAIGGYVGYQKAKCRSAMEGICSAVHYTGFIIAVLAGITLFVLAIISSCFSTTEERLAMYQEENIKIEQQIADVVNQYQEYESGIFVECAPESSVSLVSLYPELKSDTLVQKQIDVYLANNEKIKELKEELILRSVVNWWLYLGQ